MCISRLNLEEELDQMKVHASRDKTTIQELNMCLQQEREGKFDLAIVTIYKYSSLNVLVSVTIAASLRQVITIQPTSS